MFSAAKKQIIAIWNVAPDSFSSCVESEPTHVCEHAQRLCREGADILDIGAESTRPGAIPIESEEEIARLESPLSWARTVLSCPLSLDSRHPQTVEWALEQDLVDIINDIGGTESVSEAREGRIYRAVARSGAGLILMSWFPHDAPVMPFDICVKKIEQQLKNRLQFAVECGVSKDRIMLDPGIGFGKGLENDFRLISEAPAALERLGCPVLIAHSRKRCLAKALSCSLTSETLFRLDMATAMASAMAFHHGAAAVRVHCPSLNLIAKQMVTYA